MLYLISIPVFTNGKTADTEVLLKIGYTKDGNLKVRLHEYGIPGIRVVHSIMGGSEIHEKSLHRYFKKYKYPKLSEWFYYDNVIVNEFKSFTLADLDRISLLVDHRLNKNSLNYSNSLKTKLMTNLVCILRVIKPGVFIKSEEVESYFVDCLPDENIIKDKLYNNFGKDIVDNSISKIEKDNLNVTESLKNLLSKFNSLSVFYRRTKLLCDANLGNDDLKFILERVPLEYGNFFNVLGRKRIIQLGYNRVDLEREFNNRLIVNALPSAIYNRFSEGSKVDKQTIKSELDIIYKSVNYNSKSKASDIEKWFEVRDIIKVINGKRTHGFELIKKKH